MTTRERVEEVLEDAIRPALARHRGNIEIVRFDETSGTLFVRMLGVCAHCPSAELTIRGGVEMEIKERVPEIRALETVA